MTSRMEMDRLRARFDGVAVTVGEQLAAASPRFVTLVAKWSKDDLIPGLSDMDFRIVCDENTTAEDWVHIDWHVGRIHRQMVADHPEWNRINEHTVGAGVTLAEVRGDRFHHPEYAVWTPWWGRGEWAVELQARTLARPLDATDEHHHLSRFLAYYSPYIHGIDPPINLGEFEPKYALHSRCWHYYAPPMLSAATLLARRHFPGKREGLLWLAENGFVAPQTLAVLEQVEAHYESAEQGDSRRLANFERYLFTAFEELLEPVRESVLLLKLPRGATRQQLQRHLEQNLADPLVELLEHLRFARIRAGRYYFYLNAPAHFSADRQLKGEQLWTHKLAVSTFASLGDYASQRGLSTAQRLQNLGVDPTWQEIEALDVMTRLATGQAVDGTLRELYAEAIEWYPDFYRLMERTFQRLSELAASEVDDHIEVKRTDGVAAKSANLTGPVSLAD